MQLKRRKPLDEGGDTATDLLERELEGGVRVETAAESGEAKEGSVRSYFGGLLVTVGHVETHEKKS